MPTLFVAMQKVANDVVDGARSRQRGPITVIVVSESHQGATPCKLQRSVWSESSLQRSGKKCKNDLR
jgi:hypothetical protein